MNGGNAIWPDVRLMFERTVVPVTIKEMRFYYRMNSGFLKGIFQSIQMKEVTKLSRHLRRFSIMEVNPER